MPHPVRTSLRALLALALLAGLHGLVALIALLALAVVAFALASLWWSGLFNGALFGVAAALVLVLSLLVRELGRAFRPGGPAPDSVPVRPHRSEYLWPTVSALADALGTAAPTEIRLTPHANAAVEEDAWLLGLVLSVRRLYVGAPLLVGLPPEQLQAVLAHELGHCVRRHARFSGPVRRGRAALAAGQQRIHQAMVDNQGVRFFAGAAYLLVRGYRALYDRVATPVLWRQEWEADREAALLTRPSAMAAALSTVPAVAVAWHDFCDQHLQAVRARTGVVPDDPFRAFVTMRDDPEYQERWTQLLRHAVADQEPRAVDTHPPTADRLARMAALPEPAASGSPREPAWNPVGARPPGAELDPVTVRLLASHISGVPLARRKPFADWGARAAQVRALIVLEPLASAVHAVDGAGTRGLTLSRVLSLLEAGRGGALARAFAHQLPPAGAPDRHRLPDALATAVATLAGQVAVDAGAGYWTLGWYGPSRLVTDVLALTGLGARIRSAIEDPGEVARLRFRLVAAGLNPAAPVTVAREESGPVRVTPGPDRALTQRRHQTRTVALALTLGFMALGGLVWLARPEGESRAPPVERPSVAPESADPVRPYAPLPPAVDPDPVGPPTVDYRDLLPEPSLPERLEDLISPRPSGQ